MQGLVTLFIIRKIFSKQGIFNKPKLSLHLGFQSNIRARFKLSVPNHYYPVNPFNSIYNKEMR